MATTNTDGSHTDDSPASALDRAKLPAGRHLRQLVVLFGDQLDRRHLERLGFDPAIDGVLMMEVRQEALLAGVNPRAISDWYLGMYVDGVDWVTLPNTLGMLMHADGGKVGTKPYAASGRYIQRMSDSCARCPYDPGLRHGDDACPFTTLYWDFLARHRERLADNRRMAFAWKNLDRLDDEEKAKIRQRASQLR